MANVAQKVLLLGEVLLSDANVWQQLADDDFLSMLDAVRARDGGAQRASAASASVFVALY